MTNEYEAGLVRRRTGWSPTEVLSRVGTWITTLGAGGARIARAGAPATHIPPVPVPGTPSGPACSPASAQASRSPAPCNWTAHWPPTQSSQSAPRNTRSTWQP